MNKSTDHIYTCTICGHSYPIGQRDHRFYLITHASYICKECNIKRNMEYKKKRERRLSVGTGYKICVRCERQLPATLDFFNKRSSSKDGLRFECKSCSSLAGKAYCKRDEVKTKQIEVNHKRTALKKNLDSTFTAKQWRECKEHFNNECAYCGKDLHLAQEHFLALSKGGEYTRNNIIPSCKSCNSSKSNRLFFEWYPQYGYYSKQREQKILNYLNYKKDIQFLSLF